MLARFLAVALLGCGFWISAGCQKTDPRNEPVKSASPSAFGRWRSMVSDRITLEEWREFDAMLQEIRLRVTAEKQASGSEAVEAAMRSRIDGATFKDVIAMGYEARLQRLVPERNEVKYAMNMNARSAGMLEGMKVAGEMDRMRQQQEKRLKQIEDSIAEANKRLKEMGKLVEIKDEGVTPPVKR